tara:strand:- start:584 stop:733 length:150 start_codon:yes stop_codon:yes gene_type:complete
MDRYIDEIKTLEIRINALFEEIAKPIPTFDLDSISRQVEEITRKADNNG